MKKLEEKIFKFLMIGSTALILSVLLYILYVIMKKENDKRKSKRDSE